MGLAKARRSVSRACSSGTPYVKVSGMLPSAAQPMQRGVTQRPVAPSSRRSIRAITSWWDNTEPKARILEKCRQCQESPAVRGMMPMSRRTNETEVERAYGDQATLPGGSHRFRAHAHQRADPQLLSVGASGVGSLRRYPARLQAASRRAGNARAQPQTGLGGDEDPQGLRRLPRDARQ